MNEEKRRLSQDVSEESITLAALRAVLVQEYGQDRAEQLGRMAAAKVEQTSNVVYQRALRFLGW